jgi:hypothetical protein
MKGGGPGGGGGLGAAGDGGGGTGEALPGAAPGKFRLGVPSP